MSNAQCSFFITGNLVVTLSEFFELHEKTKESVVNVGVEFTGRELAIIHELSSPMTRTVPVFQDQIIDMNMAHIKELCVTNCCYMDLFSAIPGLDSESPGRVGTLLDAVLGDLGARPKGKDVITSLVMAAQALSVPGDVRQNYHAFNLSLIAGEGIRWIDRIMDNNSVRFSYSEEGGLFHVKRESYKCGCTEIMCDHGWSMRFILQAINREGCQVGALPDIDFSALFVSKDSLDESDNETIAKGSPKLPVIEEERPKWTPGNHKFSTVHDHRKWQEDQNKLGEEMSSVLSEHLEQRTQMLEKAFREIVVLNEEKKRLEDKMSEVKFSHKEDELASTIVPDDSSSTVERYTGSRRFMAEGSTYTVRGRQTALEPIVARSERENKEVVGGYLVTEEMRIKEQESFDRVYMINGLAAPFQSGRLNFLIHFHTALSECKIDPKVNPIEALEEIGTRKPINPTAELMRQAIQRTFDFSTMSVIANPFKMPFIEVGMHITESSIVKTLDLLFGEYRSSWFEAMKCLKVPDFHTEYGNISTEIYTMRRRSSSSSSRRTRGVTTNRRDSVTESGTAAPPSGKKKKQSLLGF